MLGKMVQLLGVPMEDGFSVVEGVKFNKLGTADFVFAQLKLGYNPFKDDYEVTYCWQIHNFDADKYNDGFKEFVVNNLALKDGMPEEKDVEERLWVIIPWSSEIKTSGKRIAGRYPEEAILEMKAGDTVTVSKFGAKPEVYMAVQAGNELLLVKKNR